MVELLKVESPKALVNRYCSSTMGVPESLSIKRCNPWRALAIDPGQAKCVGSGSLRWANLDRYCPPHAHERLLATLMCCWCHLQIWYFLVVLHVYIYIHTHRIHGAAIYGNIYHQYTPVMLAYIPAPWILWIYSHRAPFCLVASYESNHVPSIYRGVDITSYL